MLSIAIIPAIYPMDRILRRLMVCPPIKDPNPIPRLKIPEKIDIVTELVLSSIANIVSD